MIEGFPQNEPTVMTSGQTHDQDLQLEVGEFVHLQIEQQGVDIRSFVCDSEGRELAQADGPTGRHGVEDLYFVAQTAGQYRLGLEAISGSGQYVVCQANRRPATEDDRLLAQGAEAYREGRRLFKEGAADEALTKLQEALDVFSAGETPWPRAAVRYFLCIAFQARGKLADAVRLCDQALEAYRSLGVPLMVPLLLIRSGELRLQLGQLQTAVAKLKEARYLCEQEGDNRRLATALSRLASAHQAQGDLDAATPIFEEALRRAEEAGDAALGAGISADLGTAFLSLGRPQDALDRFSRAVEVYREPAQPRHLLVALRGIADAASLLGDFDRAEESLREALDLLSRGGTERQRVAVLLTVGQVRRRHGDFEAARAALDEALPLAEIVGDARAEAQLLLERGYALFRLDNPHEGLTDIEEALDRFVAIGDQRGEASARRRSAEILETLGRSREASARVTPAGALLALAEEPAFGDALGGMDEQSLKAARQAARRLGDQVRAAMVELAPDTPSFLSALLDIEDPEQPTGPVDLTGTDLPGGGERAGKEGGSRGVENQAVWEAEWRKLNQQDDREEKGHEPSLSQDEMRGALATDLDQLSSLSPQEIGELLLASRASGERSPHDELTLCWEYEKTTEEEAEIRRNQRKLPEHLSPHDLAESGWGVIFPRDGDPRILAALQPLLRFRSQQAGNLYQEFFCNPGESAYSFLWYRHGEAPGTIDPSILPYYLLIVGSPEEVSFEFQYQLTINHAVGRLCLPRPEDYKLYAERVVAAETDGVGLPREAALFTVQPEGDEATRLMAEFLVSPLRERLPPFAPGWRLEVWDQDRSFKGDLRRLLGGDSTPGLVLVSCHGQRFEPDAPYQSAFQGALICRRPPEGPPPSYIFHAGDVAEDAQLDGLVAFLIACHSAGTPRLDNFPFEMQEGTPPARMSDRRELSKHPFVARLPQTLLARGALAVVGHVDRGWAISAVWDPKKPSEAVRSLEESLQQLFAGHRLGHALRPLYLKYTSLAAHLVDLMEKEANKERVDRSEVGRHWIAHNNARNVIVLGDPAVYLLGKRPAEPLRKGVPDLEEAPRADRAVPTHEGAIRLGEDALAYARRKADEQGMDVGDWLSQVVRERKERGSRRGAG